MKSDLGSDAAANVLKDIRAVSGQIMSNLKYALLPQQYAAPPAIKPHAVANPSPASETNV